MNPRNRSKTARRAVPSQGLAIGKIVIPALSLALVAAPVAHAASDTWTGTSDALWSNTGNWLGGSVPGAGNTATFNSTSGNTTVDLGGGVTLGTLLFDTSSAAAYTIGSGGAGSQTLTLDTLAGGVQMNATVANDQVINANLALSTTGTYTIGLTNNSTTNTLTVAGGISASNAGTKVLTLAGSGNASVSGNITNGLGVVAITKSGAGTATLSGTNTFTGAITVNQGTLAINNSSALNIGTSLIKAGAQANTASTLTIGSGTTLTNNVNQFGGSAFAGSAGSSVGIINVQSGGALTVSSAGLAGGDIGGGANAAGALYNAGTVTNNAANSAGAGFFLGNGGASNYGYIYNTGTLTIAGRLNISQQAATSAGVVDIAGGTVTVNGTNQSANTGLQLGQNGGTSALNITNGGHLTYTKSTDTININNSANASYASVNVVGSGSKLIGTGAGTLTLNKGNNANDTATLTLANGGELDISSVTTGGTNGSNAFTFNNGTLKATAAGTLITTNVKTYVQSGGGTIDNGGVSTTIASPLLAVSGTGVTGITLTGGQTGYIGAPVVKITGGGGTGAAAIANFDPTTGTVTSITITSSGTGYTSTPTVTFVGGSGTIGTGAGTGALTATVQTGAVSSGGMTFTGSGTTTLTGANTYTGATAVNAGTLKVNGSIGASSGVTINGTGATLAGTGTVSGITLTSGTITPGDGGIGTLAASSLDWAGGNTLTFDLSAVDSTADLLSLSGALTKSGSGTYAFDFSGGTNGQTYTLINFGSNSGFSVGDFSVNSGISGTFGLSGTSLTFTAVPEPHEFAIAIVALLGVMVFIRRRNQQA
jgi:autotransporter-associated beta strand protein